jgi:hypothetical protein
MKKLTIYTIVFARLSILLIGFILLPVFFLIAIISQIANLYLSFLFAFVASTKTVVADYDNELKSKK